MASAEVEGRVLEALDAQAPSHGVEVVDVEVVGSSKAPTVRVRIDHADEALPTIALEEVSRQTAWISEALDALDLFAGSYLLEVSSPGLDRPLRRPHDYERFAGSDVVLTTTATEGRRRYTGRLEGLSEDGTAAVIACDEGTFQVPLDQVKSCKLRPSF